MKYEYKLFHVNKSTIEAGSEKMTNFGLEGWRVVDIFDKGNVLLVVMEREIKEA